MTVATLAHDAEKPATWSLAQIPQVPAHPICARKRTVPLLQDKCLLGIYFDS